MGQFQQSIVHRQMRDAGSGDHGLKPIGCADRRRMPNRLKALGLVDKIVNEPVGGAHRDHKQMAAFLKRALNDAWRQVSDLKTRELLERRYERLQSYGRFSDTKADT